LAVLKRRLIWGEIPVKAFNPVHCGKYGVAQTAIFRV